MTVRMTHPILPGQSIEIPPEAVDGHRRCGWLTDDEVDKAKRAEASPPKPAATRRTESPAASTGKE